MIQRAASQPEIERGCIRVACKGLKETERH